MSITVLKARQPSRLAVGAFLALSLAVTGCAGTYGAGQATPSSVGVASTIREGVVTGVREVQIRPDNSVVGAGVGAVLGGLAGSELGGGDKAQTAGAIGGAVLGGLAGNEAGKAMNTRPGYAYTVRFNSGEIKEIIQGADIYIAPGTPVNVAFRADGVRVTPAQYAPPPPQY